MRVLVAKSMESGNCETAPVVPRCIIILFAASVAILIWFVNGHLSCPYEWTSEMSIKTVVI